MEITSAIEHRNIDENIIRSDTILRIGFGSNHASSQQFPRKYTGLSPTRPGMNQFGSELFIKQCVVTGSKYDEA